MMSWLGHSGDPGQMISAAKLSKVSLPPSTRKRMTAVLPISAIDGLPFSASPADTGHGKLGVRA
jgi:hypothetical protein